MKTDAESKELYIPTEIKKSVKVVIVSKDRMNILEEAERVNIRLKKEIL